MAREKTVSQPTTNVLRYDARRWELLDLKRDVAKPIMRKLRDFMPMVHGSLARGDVHKGSDVDVVLTRLFPSYAVEMALGDDLPILRREIIQATPWHLIKGQISLDEDVSVTFPLVKPSPLEEQFYSFGGHLSLEELEGGLRVPGIDKRLMLIEPVEDGHIESAIVGREAIAARKVGVGLEIVKERIDVLSKRDSVGRTGIYIKRALLPEESFEEVLRRMASRDPNLKRRYR